MVLHLKWHLHSYWRDPMTPRPILWPHWRNRTFMKEGNIFTMVHWKRAALFLKDLKLEWFHLKMGSVRGAISNFELVSGSWSSSKSNGVRKALYIYIYVYIYNITISATFVSDDVIMLNTRTENLAILMHYFKQGLKDAEAEEFEKWKEMKHYLTILLKTWLNVLRIW